MRYFLVLYMTIPVSLFAQINCQVYISSDSACYQACEIATVAANHQGSKESQEQFDEAIHKCPSLDYSYFEKAVPYLKRGDFITWRKLIDKAVELNPIERLGYRGWCRYQFLRDYKGALQDFDRLAALVGKNLGYSINGDYHLNVARALCYKALGDHATAITILENHFKDPNYVIWTYDYLHMGVLKLEINQLEEAEKYLLKALQHNDYSADTYYYLALTCKKQKRKSEAKMLMEKAHRYYLKGYRRADPYTHPLDKIYLSDIERELKEL